MSGPLGWRWVSGSKRPAHGLGREGERCGGQRRARRLGRWQLVGQRLAQPRIQRMRQAPGAGGVGFFGVLLAAGGIQARLGCVQSLRALGSGCRHLHATHRLAHVPRLVQGHTCQGVEQRGQQKQGLDSQGGDGAAQHEGMRIILNCRGASNALICLCGRNGQASGAIPVCLRQHLLVQMQAKFLLGTVGLLNIPSFLWDTLRRELALKRGSFFKVD